MLLRSYEKLQTTFLVIPGVIFGGPPLYLLQRLRVDLPTPVLPRTYQNSFDFTLLYVK